MAWVEVMNRHTAYEWALMIVLDAIEPWGDDRADLRAANNTAQLMAMQAAEEWSQDKFNEVVDNLRRYLRCKRIDEDKDDF